MKKISFVLALMLIMASCTYNPTEIVEPYSFSREFTVYPTDWQRVETKEPEKSSMNTFFYYDLKVPELTSDILNNGVMSAYLIYYDKNEKIFAPLPFDDFYKDKHDFMWIEQATCEFSFRSVRFIIKYSDFRIDILPEYEYTFMIKLLW